MEEQPRSLLSSMLRSLASAQTLGAIPPNPEPTPEQEARFLYGSGKISQWLGKTPTPEINTFEPGSFLGRVTSVGESNEAFFRDSTGQLQPAIRGQHLLQWDPCRKESPRLRTQKREAPGNDPGHAAVAGDRRIFACTQGTWRRAHGSDIARGQDVRALATNLSVRGPRPGVSAAEVK